MTFQALTLSHLGSYRLFFCSTHVKVFLQSLPFFSRDHTILGLANSLMFTFHWYVLQCKGSCIHAFLPHLATGWWLCVWHSLLLAETSGMWLNGRSCCMQDILYFFLYREPGMAKWPPQYFMLNHIQQLPYGPQNYQTISVLSANFRTLNWQEIF